jgi:hypothetical protein
MFALGLGSPPAPLTYCRVHQRAWVASLDRWVAFHVPTRDGSPSTDAPCDRCAAGPQRAEGVGGYWGWSGVRAESGEMLGVMPLPRPPRPQGPYPDTSA